MELSINEVEEQFCSSEVFCADCILQNEPEECAADRVVEAEAEKLGVAI